MKIIHLYEDDLNYAHILEKVPNITLLKDLNKIFMAEGHSLRLVGGVVRDLLQGNNPKDVDLATDASPDQMIEIGKKYNIPTIPTGLQHGTITFVLNKEPHEITTLRIDKETDGRHAQIEFTNDWKLDAERRDLTFNAMSMDFNGNLFDYFGGLNDLQNGTVRFVGDTSKRIQEDYLRILRYFRFLGRVANPKIDPSTLETIKDNANGLFKISGERIWAEFSKILSGKKLEIILPAMHESSVDRTMRLPISGVGNIGSGSPKLFFAKRYTNNPATLLSTLLDSEKDVTQIFQIWKLSAAERSLMQFIILYRDHVNETVAKDLWTNPKISHDFIEELLLSIGQTTILNKLKSWTVPVFPVKGQDLMNLGMKPGPEFGKAMKYLEKAWKDSDYKLDKNDLLALINVNENVIQFPKKKITHQDRVHQAIANVHNSLADQDRIEKEIDLRIKEIEQNSPLNDLPIRSPAMEHDFVPGLPAYKYLDLCLPMPMTNEKEYQDDEKTAIVIARQNWKEIISKTETTIESLSELYKIAKTAPTPQYARNHINLAIRTLSNLKDGVLQLSKKYGWE